MFSRLDWEETVLEKIFLSAGAVRWGSLASTSYSASGLSSGVAGLSSLLLFWRELDDSGLGDLALLLGSLVLPGGGESDAALVLANGDSFSGGRQSREGYDHGTF